jgi:hypothetical protein
MNRNRFLSVLLAVAMLASIPVMVSAAPATSTPVNGTILSISPVTDPTTKVTTVIVDLLNGAGLAEKVSISLDTAVKMGLVVPAINTLIIGTSVNLSSTLSGVVNSLVLVTDPLTGITSQTVTLTDLSNVVHVVSLNLSDALSLGLITTTVDTTKIGTPIALDPTVVLASTTYNKTVTKLGTFFGTLGVTFDQLAAYQAAGFGYGVITQAAWMTAQLGGNAALLDQILVAKSTGNYSGLALPGGATVTNWGQLRKLVLTNPHQNLGSIMSGKAAPLVAPVTTSTTASNANGKGNNKGNGNGNGNGKGKGPKK